MAKQPAKGRKTTKNTPKAAAKTAQTPESTSPFYPAMDHIPAEVHRKPEVTETVPPVEKSVAQAAPSVEPEKPVPASPKNEPARQRGALPLVLGGLIAGVIGFAVGTLTVPASDSGLAEEVAAQRATISALEDRLAGLDLSDLQTTQSDLSAQISALSDELATVSEQVAEISDRPAVALDTSDPDTAAMASEMDALRAQIAEMTNAAQTELAEARAAAAAIEENAAAAARNAAARAALARVQTAMESGAPLGAALDDLAEASGQTPPDALTAVRDGVPTLASLQDGFPDVARAALVTARSEGVAGEETTGFGAFLRNQFDVRSTTPQDGDSADAILSRAQDAVRSGRLSDALAEIGALPEVARGAMSDWLAQAEARADALAAVDILSTSFSDN